ncbi:hypothetical protein SAMN05421876_104208 [Kaistella jeonii]|nr:hypothetical protein SAMN05421876_104208 [Kaistella jeonii]VEI97232.1 Uncharacterised protein [Kaistella jeonii]
MRSSLFKKILIWVAPLAIGYVMKKLQSKKQATLPTRKA